MLPVIVRAQLATRLIEQLEADEREDHVNISVAFGCSVRYMGHNPASHGASVTVRLRLGPDCGPAGTLRPDESPLIGGTSPIMTGARLESTGADEVTLQLSWKGALDFVLTPTADSRGLRLRLLSAVPVAKGKVRVQDMPEEPEGYAINLESSRQDFSAEQQQAAAAVTGVNIYVSSVQLQGERWYRLRAGPFIRRQDAEKVLQVVERTYPRAWLGVNDERGDVPAARADAGLLPALPTDAPLSDTERVRLLALSRKSLAARDYKATVQSLTQLMRQPEYPARAQAQELLGLAQERAGNLAQAKQEYQNYLLRYPQGAAASRIRGRLRALLDAGRPGGGGGLAGGGRQLGWSVDGSTAMLYQTGNDSQTVADTTTNLTSQNVALLDADVLLRRRGERFDFIMRTAGGTTQDMLQNGSGSNSRVNAFYADVSDRDKGWSARVGRQSRNGDGILGLFDGAFATWQVRNNLTLNAAAGLPVDTARAAPSTEREFVTVSADFGPVRQAWDFGAYLAVQQISGNTDRRALGLETRYFVPGRTAVLLVDYDFSFRELNSVILMGNWQLPARWTLAFDVDHRRTPVLTLRNAIIGQPVQDFSGLEALFTPSEIEQLALDRTPQLDSFALSLSRPLGERWQLMSDVYATRMGEMPTSGGVSGTPATGWDRTLQLQMSGASLMHASDLHFFGIRYQNSETVRSESFFWNARFPLFGAWRIGPRIRVDRRELLVDQSTQFVYVPELRLDYLRGAMSLEFNAGAEVSRHQLPADLQTSRRSYLSGGFRWRF